MGKLSEKLIIYLDQQFISNIAKSEENPLMLKEYRRLFEVIHKGFIDEKLVVPSSWTHKLETSLKPELKELVFKYQGFMGQIRLKDRDEIYTTQLNRVAKRFLGLESRIEDTDNTFVFYEDPDSRNQMFKVDVDMRLERFYNNKERLEEADRIDKIREVVAQEGLSYEEQLKRELESQSRCFLFKKRWKVEHLFRGDIEKLKEFAFSEKYQSLPTIEIYSKMWSKRLVSHSNSSVKSGDKTDIEIISAYLPYVDILATDRFMANIIRDLKLDKIYKTEVFDSSLKNLEVFRESITEYTEKHPLVNKPNASIFVLSDKKIKKHSFDFFHTIGCQVTRSGEWIEVFGLDDGRMPRYYHKEANTEVPFSGLQEVWGIQIKGGLKTQQIVEICEKRCRSKKFILIDRFRKLPTDFVQQLLKAVQKGKTEILGYKIYSA